MEKCTKEPGGKLELTLGVGTIELLAFRSSEILEVRISSDKNVINVKYL